MEIWYLIFTAFRPPPPELRSSRKDEVKISYRPFFPGFFCSALEGLDYAGRGSGTQGGLPRAGQGEGLTLHLASAWFPGSGGSRASREPLPGKGPKTHAGRTQGTVDAFGGHTRGRSMLTFQPASRMTVRNQT